MRRILFILFLTTATMTCAQIPVQQGVVRTIGRPNKPGVPLSGVTIRMRGAVNAVVSSAKGEFRLSATGKKDGDPLVLLSVHKNGYEMKEKDFVGRQLVFSSKVPIEIVMVNQQQLAADRKRIEDKAYQVAEQNYNKKMQQLEQDVQNNNISIEKYRAELMDLQGRYEKYLALIGDMADRYARTDYDKLDSVDYVINQCIENGELDKADSLIHTVFDPETVLERNRAAKEEIRQRIEFAQSVIDKANADKEAILRDMEYAKRVAMLCENLVGEYLAQGDSEKALDCLYKLQEIEIILYGEESAEVERVRLQLKELNINEEN